MLRIKNKLAKRIMAFVLSGAMVVSGMTTSGMTAFAAESPQDTESGYYEETVDSTENEEDNTDEKDDGKESSDKTTSDNKQASETKSSLREENEEAESPKEKENTHTEETLKAAPIESSNTSYGTVSSEKEGDNYTLTVTPAKGYMFTGWTVPDGVTVTAASALNTFTVPATSVDDGTGTITAVFEAIPAEKTWHLETLSATLPAGSDGKKTLQGKTGSLGGLWIDATSGKLGANGDWAQVNTNTVIKVPVQGVCKVTVTAYGNNNVTKGLFEVDGTEAKTKVQDFYCKGTDGWVTIKMLKNDYLSTIQVTSLSNEYIITVKDDGNGTASASPEHAANGTQVTLTAEPTTGYAFKEWKVTEPENANITFTEVTGQEKPTYTFSMPENHVTVQAVFETTGTEHQIGIANDITNGTVNPTEKTTAISGTVVELSKVATQEAAEGYEFKEWKVTYKVSGTDTNVTLTKDGKDYTFIMPEGDVTISAVFEAAVPKYVAAGTVNFNTLTGLLGGDAVPAIDGYTFGDDTNKVLWNDAQHGLSAANGSKIKLNLSKKANITIVTCCFGAGADATVTPSSGTITSSSATTEEGNNTTGMRYVVQGATGELALTFQGSATQGTVFVHSISVEYPNEAASGTRKIDVWDFGAKQESNTNIYTNNITFAVLKATGAITNGFFNGGDTQLGDVTINTTNSCRLYSTDTALSGSNTGTDKYAAKTYDDGYTGVGGWYAGGNGGESRRNLTISNVKAGDKIVAYMYITSGGPTEFYFEGKGTPGIQKDPVNVASGDLKKYEFVAKYDGTYKIWEKNVGKPFYHRIMRVPAVNVSGTIDLGPLSSLDGTTLKFVNETTKEETVATITGTSFTAKLPAGYTYNAVLSGAQGYGPTNDSKKVILSDADGVTGKSGVTIVIEKKTLYTYSGTIKGFAGDYSRKPDLKVVMKTAEDVPNDDVELTITELDSAAPAFTAQLEPDIEYTITLEGVNDYQLKGETIVKGNQTYTADIEVEVKPVYVASGNFVDLEGNAVTGVTALKFKNVDDDYEYPATTIAADGKSYTATLRDGVYSAVATIENYSTQTHVLVDGKAATKDILLVSTATEGSLERKADLYVGYSDKGDANYETVNKALNAAKRMMPEEPSESDRITIHIAPGVYREQVIVTVPYISFVNDTPSKEVKITWYYGIGYVYYSASGGFYDAQKAYDKYEKNKVDRWGCSVRINAAGFRAENIIFENSFNRYITEAEIEDGAQPAVTYGNGGYYSDTSITVPRNYVTDVESKGATERAAAIVIEQKAANAEFYNCGFYSSQDTLYTDSTAYFKNCVIEGMTDYIFGGGNCVFDACELSWKGYSETTQGGYITANKPRDNTQKGYLFRNCTVTANKDLRVGTGGYGRAWGDDTTPAKVYFVNTKLETANLIGSGKGSDNKQNCWTDMNGHAAQADFKEYNTTTLDGSTITTNDVRAAKVVTENPVSSNSDVTAYFGGWTPKHYVPEAEGDVAISGNVRVTDNADINTPKAGNTLTVHYSLGDHDANDASIIKWYTVEKENGVEKEGSAKLVKTSTAAAGKTYKIAEADNAVGKYIKVTVTPQTTSGKTGEAKSCTLDNPVAEGYEDPSSIGDITLGDGVNIFLAGDSTVKDYSAKGMNNNGKALYEGSWGEFFQTFFNESQVKVQNYAQGGRSTRTFINDGRLDSIAENMKAGDYLFIQFGHNDCADGASYADRYVPIGTPTNGIYPYTPGTAGEDGKYGNNCGGTYKWFLKLYIDTAREKGGIPVLVTPVARMYYNSNGTIKPHHDTSATSNNAYVTAMKQVAEDENVLLIDGYKLTEDLFVAAWKADGKNNDTYGKQIMATGDATHCNKLGGMIEAAVLATAIQKMDLNISGAVKAPTQVLGATPDGKTVFSVNGNGVLTANNILDDYTTKATYWEGIGQAMFDAIGREAEELNRRVGEITASPAQGTVGKNTKVTLTCEGMDGVKIYYTTDGKIPTDKSTLYTGPISLGAVEQTVTIKAIGVKTGYKNSIVCTFDYTVSGNVTTPGGEAGETEESKITADVDDKDKDKDGKISVKSNSITIKAADLVETGKVQYAVTVTYTNKQGKQQQLTEGVHYTVKLVTDGKSAGTQKINIIGTEDPTDLGTYKDTKTVPYEIKEKAAAKQDKTHDISKAKLSLDGTPDLTYTGTYITPDVKVQDVDSSNYSIVYKNNVNVGKASVTVIGKGEYFGTKTLNFSIKKADLSKSAVSISASNIKDIAEATGKSREAEERTKDALAYKGEAVTLNELTVKLGSVTLSPRSDYTVTYKKNTQAGTATAVIKGANNLSGAINVSYTIGLIDVKTALEACNTDVAALDAEYSSKGARLTSITLNGVTLKEGKDYKVNYKGCKKAEELTATDGSIIEDVTITGAGAYKNAFDKNTSIKIKVGKGSYHVKDGAVVDKSKLKGDAEKDKKTIISAAKITDAAGVKVKPEDVTITRAENNYTQITVTPADTTNYIAATLDCREATKLSSVKPADKSMKIEDQNFDGVNAITFTETEIVKTGVLGSDVKAADIRIVSYKNNNKVGSATVTVEGRETSAYYGTKSLKFKIVSKKATHEEGGKDTSDEEESSGNGPEDPNVVHTIWFVGDSTVCNYNTYNTNGTVKSYGDNYYYPRYGYGEQFKYYVDSSYTIKNLAISGCSSKDYLTKSSGANYNTLKSGIERGDILIIGFGHNDSKEETARYTNPNGTWETEGSFAKSLYDNYVKVALDAGATPILCTPIVRRSDSDNYTGTSVHVKKNSETYPGGDYRQAIVDLGAAKNIAVVDLTSLTKERWTALTAAESIYLHAWTGTTNDSSKRDNTHLNVYGAKVVAHLLATEISKFDKTTVALAKHIDNLTDVPTKAKDLVANPKYDDGTGAGSNYVPPVGKSAIWESYGIFNGSVFGNVSNEINKTNYTLSKDTDSVRIVATGNGTKISDTEDGRAMYYYAIPSDTKFKLTAKAKINAIGDDNTTAFGLMARDDMLIDTKYDASVYTNDEGSTTDYVVAGTFAKDSTNCFRRKTGALTKGDAITAVKAGETYDLALEFNGDGYTCTFGSNTPATDKYDYMVGTIDSKQYIGMFISGDADITFSDIKLIVNDKEIDITTGEEKPSDN